MLHYKQISIMSQAKISDDTSYVREGYQLGKSERMDLVAELVRQKAAENLPCALCSLVKRISLVDISVCG